MRITPPMFHHHHHHIKKKEQCLVGSTNIKSEMGPSSVQIVSKIKLQIDDEKGSISNNSWNGFRENWGSILGAKMEPKTLILEPRWAQDPQTWSQDGPRTSNLQPRWHQIAPGRLHGPIFIDFGAHFGRFLIDFEGFCNPAGLILVSISLPFCIHFCF